MRAEQNLLCVPPLPTKCFRFKAGKMGLIASVCDMYVGAPALEFATLLEVTKAVPLYVHASCT